MKDQPRSPSRREFVNTTLAATTGAGVAAALVAARPDRSPRGARFELDKGSFPEVPVTVAVSLPTLKEGVHGRAWLHIRTPREHVVEDLGEIRFHRGEAHIATRLVYPYEGRVPGAYSYHVEVACGGDRIVTEQPATYSIRKFYWFS